TTKMDSVPFEDALTPGVQVSEHEDGDEDNHLDQQQAPEVDAADAGVNLPVQGGGEDSGPRVKEDDFDIEHEENHRHDVKPDIEPLVGGADRDHPALIRLFLARPGAGGADNDRQDDVPHREPDSDD